MSKIIEAVRRLLEAEPTVAIGMVAAALALLASFGVQLDNAQANAIKDFVANALIFVGAVLGIRQSVYAPDTHAQEVSAAFQAGQVDAEAGVRDSFMGPAIG